MSSRHNRAKAQSLRKPISPAEGGCAPRAGPAAEWLTEARGL